MRTLALVGDPNSGKTTLFNALTGLRQKVGNWPGVTVERKEGVVKSVGKSTLLVDLPGIYSLSLPAQDSSMDETITRNYLKERRADFIVNVIDALNLERSLYLTSQIIDRKLPFVVVLSKLDLAKKQGLSLDENKLSERLGVPVFRVSDKASSDRLKAFLTTETVSPSLKTISYGKEIESAIEAELCHLTEQNNDNSYASALEKLEIGTAVGGSEDLSVMVAAHRYQFAHQLCKEVQTKTVVKASSVTRTLDKFFLNRLLGLPLFFVVMYAMFFVSINVGGVFQEAFTGVSQTFFVDLPSFLCEKWALPSWVSALFAEGVGQGISTTVSFIPVMFALFMFLSFLESSGYVVRAAFVMDKLMRALGLPGKAFVPMIVGFGCNVPAVMGARALDSERDRILTTLMVPFMSCSARLAIFSVFVAAFFPTHGALIVFSLYFIGILFAVLTGWVVKRAFAFGQDSILILEMPNYQWPNVKLLLRDAFMRLKHFLRRAIRVIVPVCMILGTLKALTITGEFKPGSEDSLLALIGQWLTPIFSPMGISSSNWPATVGLLSGVLAKEVVIGTLNTLYTPELTEVTTHSFHLLAQLKAAAFSIKDNALALGEAFLSPFSAAAPKDSLNQVAFGQMASQFASGATAYAYLLFTLLYVPCISTLAVIKKELNRFWMMFSLVWSTAMAYLIATAFYQLSRLTFSLWLVVLLGLGFVGLFGFVIFSLRYFLTLRINVSR